jgi:cold shock CspA family protein
MRQYRKFTGRIMRLMPQGYGFVKSDYPGPARDARFSIGNDCEFEAHEVKTGDRVAYYLEDHKRGLRAFQVSKV